MIINDLYEKETTQYAHARKSALNTLAGKKVMITGAAGLIGTYIIDIIVSYNKSSDLKIGIVAVDRNENEIRNRFSYLFSESFFEYHICDLSSENVPECKADYVIHAASNTSPVDYAQIPIDTILCNVSGTEKLLKYCKENGVTRFLFCSSVEAYGAVVNAEDEFTEEYSGYVNSNTVRSAYPTSKRLAETLCNAYNAEHGVDFVIARIGRIFGPSVIKGDVKAPTQFIQNAVSKQDIIMKSDGMQEYSFGYVGDCAAAIIHLLVNGESKEAYNIATETVRLKDFAQRCADKSGNKVVYQKQNEVEKKGYSNITKAILNLEKIQKTGFKNTYTVYEGIDRTIDYISILWRN